MNLTARLLIALILFLFAALLLGWWFFVRKTPSDFKTLVINDRVFKVEIAETMADRARGLSWRESLREDEGMLFIFPIAGKYSFWMRG
ncbi:MAG: DUF192 domain-containing protein, partial [Anaplasmataceae bacterium]|nr:DUF192 domain-containing protein [Anaplasmataceae bacterium]